jgi:hypothetical protein
VEDGPSSPAYAIDSPIFPASIISSPTKLHSVALSVEKTLQKAAEKLVDKPEVNVMTTGEPANLPKNAVKDAVKDAVETTGATAQPPVTVIIPANVAIESHETANKTIMSVINVPKTTSIDVGKTPDESFKAVSKMSSGENVSIDVVKDLEVIVKTPATPSGADLAQAEKVPLRVTSESSDVSFHTVEDVATMPSDLEVSGTDEETAVFESDKEDRQKSKTPSKMTKLWSHAVAEGELEYVAAKDKQRFTKLTRQTSVGTGVSSKKPEPLPQRPARPVSVAAATNSGSKPPLGAVGGERKAKRSSAELSPAEKNDPLPNLRKAAKNSPGLEVIVQKLKPKLA